MCGCFRNKKYLDQGWTDFYDNNNFYSKVFTDVPLVTEG